MPRVHHHLRRRSQGGSETEPAPTCGLLLVPRLKLVVVRKNDTQCQMLNLSRSAATEAAAQSPSLMGGGGREARAGMARLEHLAEGEDPGLRGEELVVLDRVPRVHVLVPLACGAAGHLCQVTVGHANASIADVCRSDMASLTWSA